MRDVTKDLLEMVRKDWSEPRIAIHRGKATSFRLYCRLMSAIADGELRDLRQFLPQEYQWFLEFSDGAKLFEDVEYGQWGLRLFDMREVFRRSIIYQCARSRQAAIGDIVIGDFRGDSDLLILRSDANQADYGAVIVANAIDVRSDWVTASGGFLKFLTLFVEKQGEKFWAQ